MSLVGTNVLNLNHESVTAILEKHLSKMFGPELFGVVVKDLRYDNNGNGVIIEFTPETPVFKDDFNERLLAKCLEKHCVMCDTSPDVPCTGAFSDLIEPGVHQERMFAALARDVPF